MLFRLEGISIGNFSPKIVGMHGPDVDVKYRRDEGVEHGTAQENLVGRGIPLEPRLIAGVKAWGYAATATFGEENTYPIQRWFLWREDGVWLISVAGFANTSVIPAELIGALDTISFNSSVGYACCAVYGDYCFAVSWAIEDRKSVV